MTNAQAPMTNQTAVFNAQGAAHASAGHSSLLFAF
jgi:hypothetical protein